MSNDIETRYDKPPDFASVYADGAIFQMTDTLTRLVFYQKEVEPTEDCSEIEKQKERVILKFEVRLDEYTVRHLVGGIKEILDLKDKAFKMERRHRSKERVLTSWYDLSKKIERFVYNTDEDEIDRKQIEDINTQYEDLKARTAKGAGRREYTEGETANGEPS